MIEVDPLPSWLRRRLNRHFERGGSGRILRWMSLPAAGGHDAGTQAETLPEARAEPAATGAVVAFAPSAIRAGTASSRRLAAG